MQPGGNGIPEIHPADAVPILWLVLGIVSLVVAVTLILVAVWVRRRRAAIAPPSAFEELRHDHLARFDSVIRRWEAHEISSADALRSASAEARGFAGIMLKRDVGSMTLEELERFAMIEPRVEHLSHLVGQSYPMRYADAPNDSLCNVIQGLRQVIREWS